MSDLGIPLGIPVDREAEEVVVGMVLHDRHGLGYVRTIVTPDDFYDWRCRCLFEAAFLLEDVGAWRGEALVATVRGAAAATIADVPIVVARQLVDRIPAIGDGSRWAARVKAAAESRRAMRAFADAYAVLGTGGSIDDARQILERVA